MIDLLISETLFKSARNLMKSYSVSFKLWWNVIKCSYSSSKAISRSVNFTGTFLFIMIYTFFQPLFSNGKSIQII